ncbi:N-formylglutamate deformylase [Hyphococcus luteus]|uniref:N-formylglutamate deformylase n=1 Tax=Hyphococcus luteus TaxID=2058213 RepID=A0A2S7KAG4_9PROT|nr:N-formylglutamate deformylase [Marinicaulis flavus]PQA89492.1 N-formylglutamate deformylase [Marinicaulis flavus]
MTPVEIVKGEGPVILAQPHSGTFMPPEIVSRLNERGKALADTDWHVDRLYDGLLPDATVVRANFHRYAIDANRDPSGASLYPGQNTTGLVPLVDFEGAPIWTEEPDEDEIDRRRIEFHAAYHLALAAEIDRVREAHGVAVLYDCHSIRSQLSFLFEGTLPDLNIGTNNGATCANVLEEAVADICAASGFSHVVNGRFRGGWTTRHYGKPETRVHAIQMEIAQSAYLESETAPFAYDEAKAEKLRAVLKEILQRINALARDGKLNGADDE